MTNCGALVPPAQIPCVCHAVLCSAVPLQVRFAYEAFRKLRPGTPLRCLHGGMKQVSLYFLCSKSLSCLLARAARAGAGVALML
jgi:hypothetical protein